MKILRNCFLVIIGFFIVLVPVAALSSELVMGNGTQMHINKSGEPKYWGNSFPEYLQPQLNTSEWDNVTDQKIGGARLTEFLPKGQTLSNWTEMVTSSYYSYYRVGHKTPSKEGVDAILENGKQMCGMGNGKFNLEILSQTHDETVYRWTMKGCGKNNVADQTEYGRFLLGKYGYHNVTYAMKSSAITPEKEANALKIVKTAKMHVDDRCGKACVFP